MSTPVDKTLRLDRTQLGQKRPSGRPPTLLIAAVAGILAAVVVGLILYPLFKHTGDNSNTTANNTTPPPPPTTESILVASQDIEPRTTIKDAMIKTISVDIDKAPQNAITSPLDAVGKVSINVIPEGAPITTDVLNGSGLSNGLAYGIDKGMRAITIPLDPVSSVAGFVKPRDHVDIIGTFDEGTEAVTKVVLQNVLLLATGAQLLPNQTASAVNTGTGNSTPDNAPAAPTGTVAAPVEIPNATVEVTPEDAQKLIMALDKGKLQLALRQADDNTIEPIPATQSETVTGNLGQSAAPAVAIRPAPPIPGPTTPISAIPVLPTVTVIKGTSVGTVTVGQ